METQDKISYGLTIKVGLPNYGSADCHISFSSSVQEGEKPEDTLARVKAFVEANLEAKKAELVAMSEADGEATVAVEEKEETEAVEAKAEPAKKKSKGLRGLARLKKNRAKAQEEDESDAQPSEAAAEEPAVEVEAKEEAPVETKKESSVSDKIAALRAKHGMTNSVGSGNSTASLKR